MFNKYISAVLSVVLSISTCVLAHGEDGDYEVFVGTNGSGLIITEQPGTIALEYDSLSGNYITDHICWVSDESIISNDYKNQPSWVIELENITFSSGLYALSEDYQQILATENFLLGEPAWEEGEGWHFHNHTLFSAATGNIGDTFTATMRLVDTNGTYQSSDPFILTFAIVPEPLTAILLGSGVFMLRKRK